MLRNCGRAALGALLAMVFGASTAASESGPTVVATIKPVHALVAAVMGDVGTPHLLVRGGGSPHAYALKPSDARALQDASLVFWVGPELETFLEKAMETVPKSARLVTLTEAPGLRLLEARTDAVWQHEEHGHEEHGHEEHGEDRAEHGEDHAEHADEHHDHAHGTHDMHIWLDPENARAMAEAIADALADADPTRADVYRTNAKQLSDRLAALDKTLHERLEPVEGKPYVVFHDAYQYFEARYHLSPAGAVTVSPDVRPGAERLREIRAEIKERDAVCVFSEPQFEPKLVRVVVEGTSARTAVLDPLGADLTDGADLYFELMSGLATSLADCLQGGPS